MKSPAHMVALRLVELGLGVFGSTHGWSVNVSREPVLPDQCVTVYDTGGPQHDTDELDISYPTFQVRVRASAYPDAYAKAQAVRTALMGKTFSSEGVVFEDVAVATDIADLGKDDQNRSLLTVNFRSMMQTA